MWGGTGKGGGREKKLIESTYPLPPSYLLFAVVSTKWDCPLSSFSVFSILSITYCYGTPVFLDSNPTEP